jgi:ABC-2 type transport system permease protein
MTGPATTPAAPGTGTAPAPPPARRSSARPFGTIVSVTFTSLLSRRRSLLVLLFVLIPIALALFVRAVGVDEDPNAIATIALDTFVVRVVLPLVALLFGTATLGSEIDDGTIVYLLAKPIPRWEILAAKLLVAEAATLALVVPSTLITGLILLAGVPGGDTNLAWAYTAGVAVGSVVYVAIFVAMSVVTSRALVLGLGYILIWEGFLAGLFAGTKNLSVREYTLSIAQAVAGRDVSQDVPIAVAVAVPLSIVVTVVAVVIAIRRLGRFEVKDSA